MHNFDFDALAALASSPADFERERARIINEHLAAIPEKQRQKCVELQNNLNNLRAVLTPDQFSRCLMDKMMRNLEDIEDQLTAVKVMLER